MVVIKLESQKVSGMTKASKIQSRQPVTSLSQYRDLQKKKKVARQMSDELIQVENATAEPFIDRFENKLAGWALSFDVTIPNNMSIC
jgi:hypothetical protein